ncbi:MAG: BBP7 family outer membrane beta-barrel protein [Gemmataceae bacterium]|nr:BBP7 family outer membrane beta-barrel protein [Gemmataceae bacterium]MCI0737625.1 BBP7 family outer membrane beta-barrel protein [Gemmataceae bacterium]
MRGKFAWVVALNLALTGSSWGQTVVRRNIQEPPLVQVGPAQTALEQGTGVCAPDCHWTPRVYASVDYLWWWIQDGPVPAPLVSTAAVDTPTAGTIGDPETVVLFGGKSFGFGDFAGLRFNVGVLCDPSGAWGLEAGGFFLEERTVSFAFASDAAGSPLITRPFFDNLNHQESAYDVSSQGRFRGRMDITGTTELWGGEINAVIHPDWGASDRPRHDLFIGFRSLALDESLIVQSELVPLQAGILVFKNQAVDPQFGSQRTMDTFGTTNRFYGPQLGARFNWDGGYWGAGLTAKVALGVNQQKVNIFGESLALTNGVVVDSNPGGILSQNTNIGHYSRNEFTLAPEIGAHLYYDVTDWLRARVGYNLLYLTSVVRPGSQIDRNIDVQQVAIDPAFTPGLAASRPRFVFRDSDFWAHGFNFGLEVRY